MKIFDRHIACLILTPLLGVVMALLAMWVIYDLVERVNDFLYSGASVLSLAVFYLRSVPMMLPTILPIATLVSTLSALMMMTRGGETIALLSGGVGMMRISVPFLVTGAVAGICQFFVETNFAPLALRERNEQIDEFRAQARNRERRFGSRLRTVVFFYEKQNRIWFIRRADTMRQELLDVEILQIDDQGRDVWKLFSRQMTYDNDSGWNAKATRLVRFSAHGSVESEHTDVGGGPLGDIDENFTQVAAAVFTADVLSFSELKQFLKNNQQLSARRLAPYSSALVRQAWSYAPCFGAVVVAFGLCFKALRRGGLAGFGIPIGLYILYMLLDKFCFSLGEAARLPPEFIVSVPHFLWVVGGVFLFVLRQKKFL